jgi:hypothetical protein
MFIEGRPGRKSERLTTLILGGDEHLAVRQVVSLLSKALAEGHSQVEKILRRGGRVRRHDRCD